MPIRTIVNYLEPYGVQVNRLIMMIYFKKLNYYDVMNLVEGVVSEVYVAGDVKIVCAGESSLLLSYGSEQTMLIEDAYLFDCLDAAIIINERVVQHFSASQPLVDCGEYYMTVSDYIESEWNRGCMNFECLLTNNEWLRSCTVDESSREKLPIWDWYIGHSDGNTSVTIGDVRKTYTELFNNGNLIQDMVAKLFSSNR